MSEERDLRLAVLIDADNAPRSALGDVMAEVAVYGTPTIKRIYGDWTTPNLASWKPLLLENAITPVQQYGYTTGKNSTDSAMISTPWTSSTPARWTASYWCPATATLPAWPPVSGRPV